MKADGVTTPSERSTHRSATADESPAAFDLIVFLAELVLLAVLAVSGARLGGDVIESIVLALVLPIAAAAVWARLLAPRAPSRLRRVPRVALKLALVVAAAVLLAASGAVVWAIGFGVVTAVVFAVGERPTTQPA